MSTETDTTVIVHDKLTHLAVTVEGHTIRRGEPTELPTELAERLLGDNTGWRPAAGSAAAATTGGPYDGLPLDQLRGLMGDRGIEHEGRLTFKIAIELLTAYDAADAESATD